MIRYLTIYILTNNSIHVNEIYYSYLAICFSEKIHLYKNNFKIKEHTYLYLASMLFLEVNFLYNLS